MRKRVNVVFEGGEFDRLFLHQEDKMRVAAKRIVQEQDIVLDSSPTCILTKLAQIVGLLARDVLWAHVYTPNTEQSSATNRIPIHLRELAAYALIWSMQHDESNPPC